MNRHGRSKAKCADCGMHPIHPIHGSPGGFREWAAHEYASLMQYRYGHDWQLRFRPSQVPEIRERIRALCRHQ